MCKLHNQIMYFYCKTVDLQKRWFLYSLYFGT